MIKLNNKKGFTLIELMIVIAIIGILAAIAIPNFIEYRNKAFCTKAETDAHSILAAISSYFSEPARTTIPTIAQLKSLEKLALNNNVTVEPALATGVITVVVPDSSGRCPRAAAGTKSFYAYMGTQTQNVWK
jgi:type IV pilus assembly protein PilA